MIGTQDEITAMYFSTKSLMTISQTQLSKDILKSVISKAGLSQIMAIPTPIW